jgi:predicted lipid-binding transport protein (Tim44 family)
MTRLTAAVCCFALSGFFAWVSGSVSSAALNARAHATSTGAFLMVQQPVSDNGLAGFAMFASILMLLIGIGCLIASMLPRKSRPRTEQPDLPQTSKSSSPQSDKPSPHERRQQAEEQATKVPSTIEPATYARRQRAEAQMRRWTEEDKLALAAGKRKPLQEMPRLISTPVSSP